MSRTEEAIALFVDDIDAVVSGAEVRLAQLPAATVTGRVILLEHRELKLKGGVTYVVGIAESFAKGTDTLTIQGASRLALPIVVGLGAEGENVRPDLFPCKFWGPSSVVYLSADVVTRVEAEVARLLVHQGANALR